MPQRGNNNKNANRPTRRLLVGWKHAYSSKTFTNMSVTRGGGRQAIDVDRDQSLAALQDKLCGIYFPGGTNLTSKLCLSDMEDVYVASFSETRLLDSVGDNGEPFTVGRYVENMASSPIRLYLLTIPIMKVN